MFKKHSSPFGEFIFGINVKALSYFKLIRSIVARFPAVKPHLRGRARWIANAWLNPFECNQIRRLLKYHPWYYDDNIPRVLRSRNQTDEELIRDWEEDMAFSSTWWVNPNTTGIRTYAYMEREVERMIRHVYDGYLGGEFIDLMANLISGQLSQAYEMAWRDEGSGGELPEYLSSALEDAILYQYDYVDQLYRDIVDAKVEQSPIEPLLSRAPLWANRWNEAYNEAVRLIMAETGGRLIWQLGETEKHCSTCAALNNLIAFASEWDELGIHPQGAPNDALECGGWQCDCSLIPTDKRRSPNAYDRIIDAVAR